MVQEIGESREAWGWDVMKMAEEFANNMSKEERPFYIVYACKPDTGKLGVFRQTMKAYYHRPQPMLGILVWYVDHSKGQFKFCADLSAPPDMPLDPELLSDKASDASESVMAQGEKLKALVS